MPRYSQRGHSCPTKRRRLNCHPIIAMTRVVGHGFCGRLCGTRGIELCFDSELANSVLYWYLCVNRTGLRANRHDSSLSEIPRAAEPHMSNVCRSAVRHTVYRGTGLPKPGVATA